MKETFHFAVANKLMTYDAPGGVDMIIPVKVLCIYDHDFEYSGQSYNYYPTLDILSYGQLRTNDPYVPVRVMDGVFQDTNYNHYDPKPGFECLEIPIQSSYLESLGALTDIWTRCHVRYMNGKLKYLESFDPATGVYVFQDVPSAEPIEAKHGIVLREYKPAWDYTHPDFIMSCDVCDEKFYVTDPEQGDVVRCSCNLRCDNILKCSEVCAGFSREGK